MATYNILGYDSTNNLPTLPSSSDVSNVQGDLTVAGDQIITGNLTVNGTTTTVNSEIATADDMIHLNSNYTNTSAAKDAGFIFTVEPLGTAVASTNFISGNTVESSGGFGAFSVGDVVQISGATEVENNGLFEIHVLNVNQIQFKDGTAGKTISASLVDICRVVAFTNGADTGATVVKVKVMQLKTDEANDQLVYKYGSTASNMSADQTFGGSIAADDITAGDAAVEITTTSGDVVIDSPTGQAVRLQVNGDDKLVCDGDDIQVKSGKNLLIEDSAALATQLLFAGSSVVGTFDALYINTSGELARADADGGTLHYNVVGSALEAGPSGAAAVKAAMTTSGQAAGFTFTGGNPATGDRGKPVYLSKTAGQVTLTAPSASGDHVVRIGFVYSSTALTTNVYPVLFQPQYMNQVA